MAGTSPAMTDGAVVFPDCLSDLTAKASANVAARYDADIDALYMRLERYPESGSPRPALGRLVRIGIVSLYNIIH
jgi:plasmid stabilization system protein ParE